MLKSQEAVILGQQGSWDRPERRKGEEKTQSLATGEKSKKLLDRYYLRVKGSLYPLTRTLKIQCQLLWVSQSKW